MFCSNGKLNYISFELHYFVPHYFMFLYISNCTLNSKWCHPDVYIDYTHYYLTTLSITQSINYIQTKTDSCTVLPHTKQTAQDLNQSYCNIVSFQTNCTRFESVLFHNFVISNSKTAHDLNKPIGTSQFCYSKHSQPHNIAWLTSNIQCYSNW